MFFELKRAINPINIDRIFNTVQKISIEGPFSLGELKF